MKFVKRTVDIPTLLIHIFGFVLLWEWLRPLTIVTDTAELHIFVIFIALCFVLHLFSVKVWISSLIKIIVIFIMIHGTYYETGLFNPSWITSFFSVITNNITLIFQANWWDISNVFRSFLFFILLWLMSYLVYYWMIHRKRIFVFFVITIIYITILDTFSPYIANGAIVRTLLFGFFMLGILHIERVFSTERLSKFSGIFSKWVLPLLVIVLVSTTVGYFTPKAAPQWPDPVPYLRGYGEPRLADEDGLGVKKIGYGTNDSQLGGPFYGDDTPVFRAQINKRHYWRVETKDFYTGKGWENSFNPENRSFTNENDIVSWYEGNTETERVKAEITMEKKYFHITYPAGLASIEANSDVFYSVDPLSEKISSREGSSAVVVPEYVVNYDYPTYSVNDLQAVTGRGSLERDEEFLELYTQLPDTLPERVKELGEEITKEKQNRYDKVVAVERYFRDNLFVYDTQDVAVPAKDQDYVDQFLFDTKTGYCDNFSTTMIVLLRSVGIPARWVKGYTEGTYQEAVNENERIFEITNNNAHSWVEVYFPNFGWIPFEPTRGFSNPVNFLYNTSVSVTAQNQNQSVQIEAEQKVELEEEDIREEQQEREINKANREPLLGKSNLWKKVFIYIGGIAIIWFIFIKTRNKWYPFILILRYKYSKNPKNYFKAYTALLKQLELRGLKRKEGQTLREYAKYVDFYYGTTDMTRLTLIYERALYRNDEDSLQWNESVELWENLIKRLSS